MAPPLVDLAAVGGWLAAARVRLAANAEAVRALASGLGADQARWRPAPEAWSLLEVVNHLLDEEREDFRARLGLVLRDPAAPWPPIDPQGWPRTRDYQSRDLAASLEAFLGERRASLDWLAGLESTSWGASHPHPSAGPIRAADLLDAWIGHDHLHLRQMNELQWQYLARDAAPGALTYAGGW